MIVKDFDIGSLWFDLSFTPSLPLPLPLPLHPPPPTSTNPPSAPATPVSHAGLPETAVVHPLVLLSAVDHYNRVAKNTKKRIVGILLGQRQGSVVNVANSFAGGFILCVESEQCASNISLCELYATTAGGGDGDIPTTASSTALDCPSDNSPLLCSLWFFL